MVQVATETHTVTHKEVEIAVECKRMDGHVTYEVLDPEDDLAQELAGWQSHFDMMALVYTKRGGPDHTNYWTCRLVKRIVITTQWEEVPPDEGFED